MITLQVQSIIYLLGEWGVGEEDLKKEGGINNFFPLKKEGGGGTYLMGGGLNREFTVQL